MLLALAVAALIVAPHIYWLIGNFGQISGAVASKSEFRAIEGGLFANHLAGLNSAASSLIGFICLIL